MYNEFIGGNLQLPIQGALCFVSVYPRRSCLGKWQSRAALGYGRVAPVGRRMRNVECSYNMPGCCFAKSFCSSITILLNAGSIRSILRHLTLL